MYDTSKLFCKWEWTHFARREKLWQRVLKRSISFTQKRYFILWALRVHRQDKWDGGRGFEHWPWTCCSRSCEIWAVTGLWLLRTWAPLRLGPLWINSDEATRQKLLDWHENIRKIIPVWICGNKSTDGCSLHWLWTSHNLRWIWVAITFWLNAQHVCCMKTWHNHGPFIINEPISDGAYTTLFYWMAAVSVCVSLCVCCLENQLETQSFQMFFFFFQHSCWLKVVPPLHNSGQALLGTKFISSFYFRIIRCWG